MKKNFLAIIFIIALSASFASKTNAQTKAIFIEDLSAKNIAATTSAVSTETPIYNKSGKLLYTVKRYQESALPKQVNRLVRNQFYDFDIVGVEEVTFPLKSNAVYFVHIANEKKLETVRVYNNDTEVINEYNKG